LHLEADAAPLLTRHLVDFALAGLQNISTQPARSASASAKHAAH
jgi:hypothetical protein